ncbi:LysR family transcriptional regulator [Anaerotruncus colihominis]|jgi:DNA-binding transcriptional LysR family regulator|uniref:LysR family transcriptional regulator n=2 Tax=Anaerotruncus colihominis TaxID=169435 RepID=A0A845RIW7_9FIRM|nr:MULTISPECIES: LysR family transcriptional regulator [Anaerotruncus]MCI8491527.1 LysR family transcriptional regulator [Anaerotruncus sp.]NBI78775.1 LysR family transcriptional regulator [Anaerotruncus colihominis]
MQLSQLMYFITVAEQGSINKAAEKLFVTQPNLSKAIGNLESELKVRIFDRTNKGVMLTEDGKKLYQYARTILNQMELISGLSANERVRMLSIASYPIITMGRLVSEFYNLHKQEGISLKLVEQRMQQVLESVESGEAEIGFIMSNHAQAKELKHMLHYKNLQYHTLGADTWYANVGPHSPLYGQDEVTMQQLLQYPIVRLPDDYFSNLTHYLEIDGVRLIDHKRVIYVSDSAAIIELLRMTDVFRYGPGVSAADFEEYGVRTIPIRNCKVQISAGWLQRRRELLSPEAQAFVALLEGLYPCGQAQNQDKN